MFVKSDHLTTFFDDQNCLVTDFFVEANKVLRAIDFTVKTHESFTGIVGVVSAQMSRTGQWLVMDYPVFANEVKGFRNWLRILRKFESNEFLKIVWKDAGYHEWMLDRMGKVQGYQPENYPVKIKAVYE